MFLRCEIVFFLSCPVFYGVINIIIDYVFKALCSSWAVNAPQFSEWAFVLLGLSKTNSLFSWKLKIACYGCSSQTDNCKVFAASSCSHKFVIMSRRLWLEFVPRLLLCACCVFLSKIPNPKLLHLALPLLCECMCMYSWWAGWHLTLWKSMPLVYKSVWMGECWLGVKVLWVVQRLKMQSIEHLEDTERKNTHSLNFLQTLTQDKGIHDDTRDGCSNQKAKGSVHVEIRSKSCILSASPWRVVAFLGRCTSSYGGGYTVPSALLRTPWCRYHIDSMQKHNLRLSLSSPHWHNRGHT